MWVTNSKKNLNDSYEIYISAKNSSYKTQAENLFLVVNDAFLNHESFTNDYSIFESFSLNFENLLDNTILSLDNFVASNTFSQASIDTLKEKFQWYLQNYKQNYSTYVSLKLSLGYEHTSKDIRLKEQENKITTLNWELLQV